MSDQLLTGNTIKESRILMLFRQLLNIKSRFASERSEAMKERQEVSLSVFRNVSSSIRATYLAILFIHPQKYFILSLTLSLRIPSTRPSGNLALDHSCIDHAFKRG